MITGFFASFCLGNTHRPRFTSVFFPALLLKYSLPISATSSFVLPPPAQLIFYLRRSALRPILKERKSAVKKRAVCTCRSTEHNIKVKSDIFLRIITSPDMNMSYIRAFINWTLN